MARSPDPPGRSWIAALQQYWWLLMVVGGGAALWGNLPRRVEKVEATQSKQAEELDDLKGWAREIQGYTKAMQAQQSETDVSVPALDPATAAARPRPRANRVVKVKSREGRVYCRDSHAWWWPDHEGRCEP